MGTDSNAAVPSPMRKFMDRTGDTGTGILFSLAVAWICSMAATCPFSAELLVKKSTLQTVGDILTATRAAAVAMKPSTSTAMLLSEASNMAPTRAAISAPPRLARATGAGILTREYLFSALVTMSIFLDTASSLMVLAAKAPPPQTDSTDWPVKAAISADDEVVLPIPTSPRTTTFAEASLTSSIRLDLPILMHRAHSSAVMAGSLQKLRVPLGSLSGEETITFPSIAPPATPASTTFNLTPLAFARTDAPATSLSRPKRTARVTVCGNKEHPSPPSSGALATP
mmetsp:Transcript_4574/g.12928  ORF Transcript_4574/g.12928 Transcript_4574/m.12928 type:complete len:284 (-) Transcript_4574:1418-2269(-)